MKPIYVMSYDGNVRPTRATREDLEFHVENPGMSERLVHMTIDAHGDIVTTPLTAEEIATLGAAFKAEQEQKLRTLLDGVLALAKLVEDVPGAMWSAPVALWPANEPWSERVMRTWAADNSLTVEDEAPPRNEKNWIRCARVYYGRVDLVRCQWPSVRLGDVAVAIEAMSVGVASVFASQEAA